MSCINIDIFGPDSLTALNVNHILQNPSQCKNKVVYLEVDRKKRKAFFLWQTHYKRKEVS